MVDLAPLIPAPDGGKWAPLIMLFKNFYSQQRGSRRARSRTRVSVMQASVVL